MVSSGQKPVKGHIIIRKLDGLAVVAPDVIVMTGDSLAVQKALAEALKKNPALAEVPAIRDHAIFTLPGYIDAGVMEYPHILQRWVEVLSL
jgi:ABC-type hemin transport system substrate-binding protein